jgi:glycosyltransferase involved in cell wall biosynthesis
MRNCERYVRQALESILTQGEAHLEIVVVDDGSTDRSAELVRSLGDTRVRVIPGPRQGIAAALNAGLAAAQGEFFARCDADDYYPPGRLSWQVRFLKDHPDFGAVLGSFIHVDEQEKLVGERAWGKQECEVTGQIRRGIGKCHLCAFLIRMDAMRALGGFRPYFVATEDADFVLRLGEQCRVWYAPQTAYIWRLHGSSITHVQSSAQRKFLEHVARTFQKQRLETGMDDLMRGCPPAVPHELDHRPRRASEQIQALMLGSAWQAHADGRRWHALATGWRACLVRPLTWSAWWSLAALAVKPAKASAPPTPSIGHDGGGRP